jgi:hypothetical protein
MVNGKDVAIVDARKVSLDAQDDRHDLRAATLL